MFPVVVALWFGALFGLGSLAIRPGLIESVVLTLHIDRLIPSAAPPLGITARILLALGMGAIGAVLGGAFARRLTRPKPVPAAPRRRGAVPASDGFAQRNRDAHPDAPARRPISAHEELGEDDLAEETTAEAVGTADGIASRIGAQPVPGRRRALAITDDAPRDYHDLAPLPGGAPQILDIGAFVMDDAPQASEPALSELDLGVFAPPPPPLFAEVAPFAEAAPIAVSQPYGEPLAYEALPSISLGSVRLGPAQADGTPVAYEVSAEPLPEAADPYMTRVPVGAAVPAVDGARPGSIFDIPVASNRLFERPADDEQPLTSLVIAPASALPVGDVVKDASTVVTAYPAPEPAPARFTLPEGPAAARISSASLLALSQVELIERLALSLSQRRNLDGQIPLESKAPLEDQPFELVAEAAIADEPAPLPYVAPIASQDLARVSAADQATTELPAFDPPVAAPVIADSAGIVTIPSAMRPMDFDDADHFDDLPSFLPPRQLTMVGAPASVPVTELAPMLLDEASEVEVEAEVAGDDNYSSLLDIRPSNAAPRQSFVRIEEPQALAGEIEPVVIFPGQGGFHKPAAQTSFAQPASPFAPSDIQDQVMRRFDAPGSTGVPSQATADMASPLKDPVETERALRAALSSLQRMSGAA